MGYNLVHANGISTDFPVIDFIKLLELGLLFGWTPSGAVPVEFNRYKFVKEKYGASTEVPAELFEEEYLSDIEDRDDTEEEGQEGDGSVEQLRSYSSNDGNWVTNEDARSLASALQAAVGHIPDHAGPEVVTTTTEHHYSPHPVIQGVIEAGQNFTGEILNHELAPFQYFAGERKKLIQRMIHYCHSGGFFID